MTPFRLEIITPEKTFFDGNTEQIIARTTVGDVGILNGHEPYCAALGIGQMRVMIDGKFRGDFRRYHQGIEGKDRYPGAVL